MIPTILTVMPLATTRRSPSISTHSTTRSQVVFSYTELSVEFQGHKSGYTSALNRRSAAAKKVVTDNRVWSLSVNTIAVGVDGAGVGTVISMICLAAWLLNGDQRCCWVPRRRLVSFADPFRVEWNCLPL